LFDRNKTHGRSFIYWDEYCKIVNYEKKNFDCGLGGIVLDEIIGRSDDVFNSPNGNTFSRFSLCLKYLPQQVIKSKLVLKQESYDVKLILETVDRKILEIQEFKDFESKFISMMGSGFNFDYQYTKKIDFGKNG
jgi:hypothetical protein